MLSLSQLEQTVLGFVSQGDEYVLLLSCADTDVPLVHKLIERVDQEAPMDVYLRFAEPFANDAGAWVDAVLQSLSLQLAGANVLRAGVYCELWPELPVDCRLCPDPWDRLDIAIAHVGRLLPQDEDHRVLWTFLPTSVADPVAYTKFMTGFLPPQAWRKGHRILLRSSDLLVGALTASDEGSALQTAVDFSPAALASDLASQAADPGKSPRERANALFQLAGMDISYARVPEALRKFAAVYAFYDKEPDSEGIQGMCLIAAGMAAEHVNPESSIAFDRYRQALALCAPHPGCLGISMMACDHLGDISGRKGDSEDALGYYDLANQIATKLCNLPFKVDLLEKIGRIHQQLQDPHSAIRVWKQGLALARDGDYAERIVSLQRLLQRFEAPLIR